MLCGCILRMGSLIEYNSLVLIFDSKGKSMNAPIIDFGFVWASLFISFYHRNNNIYSKRFVRE